ncbi:hypothetical protein ACXR2U_19445 [Jatrophihabitans sp. YIM 134969]
MTHRLVGTGYGVVVGLEVADAALAAVTARLPFWWRPTGAEPDAVFRVDDPADTRDVLAELQLFVAEHAEDLVFVHAGVVAVGGRALLLPGRSHAGKSTLVAALLEAGATYGSDEYAPLTPDGRVLPYPRPLTMRTPDGRVDRPVAGPLPDGPLPVGAVAVLRYEAAAVHGCGWSVVPPAEAVLHLLDNTVCARSRPEDALVAVVAVAEGAPAAVGVRPDAVEVVRPLLELLASAR